MTGPRKFYLKLLDRLRERRSEASWQAEDDRETLALLVAVAESFSEEEQELTNDEGWRSWPDLYESRMEALTESSSLQLDEAEPTRLAA